MKTRKAINLSLESLEKRDVPSNFRSVYNPVQDDTQTGIRNAYIKALERHEDRYGDINVPYPHNIDVLQDKVEDRLT